MALLSVRIFMVVESAAAGSFAAESLKKRLKTLKQVRIMLESLRLMIRYEALEVSEIIRRLSENSELSELGFIAYLQKYSTKCFDAGDYCGRLFIYCDNLLRCIL